MLLEVQRLRDWLPKGEALEQPVWTARHRAIVAILWLHVLGVPIFAVVRGYGIGHAIAESSPLLIAAIVASVPSQSRTVRSFAATFGLLSASAVLVHLSSGVIEMHFHFFVMVPLVVLYQDWVPFLLAIVYVLVHHGLMGTLYPESVYNHPAAINSPWKWAAIHALFVSAASAVCLVTWRMNERARMEAERARSRLAMLSEVSGILASSLDADDIIRRVGDAIVPRSFVACAVDLCEGDELRRVMARPDDATVLALAPGPDTEASDHPRSEALRTGKPCSIRTEAASTTFVPLIARGRPLGVLVTVAETAEPEALDVDDETVAAELGRRLAAALENALLYSRERGVAETLQRSLLPESFPVIPGLSAVARYSPGGPGVEVGGDWYDVFELPSGRVAIAMGDVVGRGIPAASLMGQLRNALRAYASEGHRPAEVVEKLNRMVFDHDPDHLATLCYAEVDAVAGELRFASAGHPPPLLVVPGGAVVTLDGARGVPLGAVAHPRFEESTANVPDGGSLVLYTDGLVEDRELVLGDGIDRVRAALRLPTDDLEALADAVVEQATASRTVDDDVALLIVRLDPLSDELRLELPSEPRSLATARSGLRRWLTQSGVVEPELYEILVAAGEACANAVEHATGPASGTFLFRATRDGGHFCICVRDFGTWRPRRAGPGGRGLNVMRAFVDDVEIDRLPDGTEVRLFRSLDRVPVG